MLNGKVGSISLNILVACLFILLLYKIWILFSVNVHQIGMIPFSVLSRFSGHFGGDGPSLLNRDTTVFKQCFMGYLTLFKT